MIFSNEEKGRIEWNILSKKAENSNSEEVKNISNKLGISPVVAQILFNRGCKTAEDAIAFINVEKEMLHDPFLLPDMKVAVDRIIKAISSNEKIVIYGDYDVDGVTSVSTLYLYLKEKNAQVDYYIPNRIGEGYGVSVAAIDSIATNGVGLIITVDNGTTAFNEVDYAKKFGIDFVITDHHECQDVLPNAVAIVNPHRNDSQYPFKDLAGVGVVFKLVCAIEEVLTGDTRVNCVSKICEKYIDLIGIGTIADVMPVCDENKLIVKYGLDVIERSPRPGIKALIDGYANNSNKSSNKNTKINSNFIGYNIAPKINAAGRVRTATKAVELFLASSKHEAARIAKELEEANIERKNEENTISDEAFSMIEQEKLLKDNKIVIVCNNYWHHGVIGIVSSRITEKYNIPSILISFDGCDDQNISGEDIGKGSGRSVKGLNLVNALSSCTELLEKFGGHELAAGLSIKRKNIPAFIDRMNSYIEKNHEDTNENLVDIDDEITISSLSVDVAKQLALLEPFGIANVNPIFLLRNLRIIDIIPISGGKHTKLIVGNDHSTIAAMWFNMDPKKTGLYVGNSIDLAGNLDLNTWNGIESVQIIVRYCQLSEEELDKESNLLKRFDEIWNGSSYTEDECVYPERNDFVLVYNYIYKSIRNGNNVLTFNEIINGVSSNRAKIGFIKLKFIIKIFQEMNILSIDEIDDDKYAFSIRFGEKKTDLEKSNILKKIRNQMSVI